MTAPHLNLRVDWSEDRQPQPQAFPRLIAILVAILALLNVSATMLMLESWVSIVNGILELESTLKDGVVEAVDRALPEPEV